VLKLSLRRLILFNLDPGGIAIPSNHLLIEPRHMRRDDSRPGDLYAIAGGCHAKDATIDVLIKLTEIKFTTHI
jgi:hypothetical protein